MLHGNLREAFYLETICVDIIFPVFLSPGPLLLATHPLNSILTAQIISAVTCIRFQSTS